MRGLAGTSADQNGEHRFPRTANTDFPERRTQISQISPIPQQEQVVLFSVNLRNPRNPCSPFFAPQ
jgi:hypothetical protein